MVDLDTYQGSVYVDPAELPQPSHELAYFRDALVTAQERPLQVISFERDVVAPACESGKKTLTQGCIEQVASLTEKHDHDFLYTHDPETAQRLAGMGEFLVSRTSIGETSAHQVFFAALTRNRDMVRVAVKPFVAEPHKAVTDWVNTLLARQSSLRTFKPLAFMVNGYRGYTITEREDGIDSLDNSDWTTVLAAPERHAGMLEALVKIGPELARLHEMGCYHGDVQLKNIVIDETGAVHLIDWEAATFMLPSAWWKYSERQGEIIARKSVRDLKVLFGSLAKSVGDKGVGLLDHLTPAAQYSYFQELILRPYVTERLRYIEHESPENIERAAELIMQVEEDVKTYVLSGELYKTLARNQHKT